GSVARVTSGFLLLTRIFKLGFLADFFPRTVLGGFLNGVVFRVGMAILGSVLAVASCAGGTLAQAGGRPRVRPRAEHLAAVGAAGAAGCHSPDDGVVWGGGGRHPDRQSGCPACAVCAGRSNRKHRGER